MIKIRGNRGAMGIIIFFLLLLTILVIGFVAVIVTGVVDYTSDIVTPIMNDLGVVSDTNLSQVSGYTFGTVNTLTNSLPWIVAFGYIAMLIFSVAFIISWNYSPNPIFIGLYFIFMILLIMGSIVMSNMYQDIYTGTDVLAVSLQNQPIMSFLILQSPMIFVVIGFIVGVYLFAGKQNENQGGF